MADTLFPILRKYWGYETFRPHQEQAIGQVLGRRDSVVVLPTGGGKSLCYQVPALVLEGVAVVISPLLSLMKDQVDALHLRGVAAGCINSMQTPRERTETITKIKAGKLKLLYVAPERLASDSFLEFLRQISPAFFAVDEAHCISSWGHEFRPDYRRLAILRETFPNAGVHAFTATATVKVREDIAAQLRLRDPAFLVGSFDRPNLIYRVARRLDRWRQLCEIIERHRDESGIIYCISRRKVDDLAGQLREAGYRALPYHAGMEDTQRKRNQESFAREDADIIVATVAFGMGIDKSNVRYVIHAESPRTVENYQQEAGRAGRDGLPAECVLLWSPGDFVIWRKILGDLEDEPRRAALEKLQQMSRFCERDICRHSALVSYFGQAYDRGDCEACDHCLSDVELETDALTIAQKILSCVVRLGGGQTPAYVGRVLVGSKDSRISEQGHDRLSTYGILAGDDRRLVADWLTQLRDHHYLQSVSADSGLTVTDRGRRVLRGEETPRLVRRVRGDDHPRSAPTPVATGVDRELFEELRRLRKRIADERNVPAFIVFNDATLVDMAQRRPGSLRTFMNVNGVGEMKCREFGRPFVECITSWCQAHNLPTDALGDGKRPPKPTAIPPEPVGNGTRRQAFDLFRKRMTIDEVARATDRARSTVVGYLYDFIQREGTLSPAAWVDEATSAKIVEAARRVGLERLQPIHEALGGTVDYDAIRIVVACLRNAARDCQPVQPANQQTTPDPEG